MPLLLRQDKGTALTNTELDGNFIFLNSRINAVVGDVTALSEETVPGLEASLTELISLKQTASPKLSSLSALDVVGVVSLVDTSSGEFATRVLQSGTDISITNSNGVAGNPTIDIGPNVLTNTSTHVLSNKTISGNNNTIESIPAASLTGVVSVARGGTGGSTQAAARASLNVLRAPQAVGVIVQTSPDEVAARQIDVSGQGLTITNPSGVTGNPVITINSTTNATPSTVVLRDSSGNFSANTITANLVGNASSATVVSNGVYTTQSYANPSWITSLAGSKVTAIPNSSLVNSSIIINGVNVPLGQPVTLGPITLGGTPNNTPSTLVMRDPSGNFSASTITANLVGNASSASVVANGVYTTGSYANPSWITSLAGSKVTAIPNSSLQNSFVSINGFTVALGQAATLPFVRTDQSYANPSWITSLAGSKVTDIPNSSLSNFAVTINGVQVSLGSSVNLNAQQLGGVSSNTPSTIVARDASGDFAAGTITATLNGNASSATTALGAVAATRLATPRTINGVQFDGTQNITVTDATKLPLSGGSLSGFLTLNANPINNLHAATKQYVDTVLGSIPSGVKAWVTFNGVNGGILGAQNVTSVSVIGDGRYQINIAPGTFSNGNFAAAGMASDVDHLVTFNNSSQTTLIVYTTDTHADTNNTTSRTTGRVMVLMVGT